MEVLSFNVTLTQILGFCVCFAIATIIYQLRVFREYRHTKKCLNKLPGPPTVPILGNALSLRKPTEVLPNLLNYRKQYGNVYRMWLGYDPAIAVSDPDIVGEILNSQYCLNKGDRLVDVVKPLLGNGLLFSKAETWKPRRKLLVSTFSPKILESFMPILNHQNKVMVDCLKESSGKGKIDLWDYVSKMSLDSICGTAMGVDLRSQTEDSAYSKAAYEVLKLIAFRICTPWTHVKFLFDLSSTGRLYKKLTHVMNSFTQEVVVRRKKEIENQPRYDIKDIGYGKNPEGRAFLDYMIELSRQDNLLTAQDLQDEVATIMITGFETTANSLCFCLLLMAIHHDIQEKVYDEIHSFYQDSNRDVGYEDLQYFPYLEMVIKETLRKYPIVPIFFRKLAKDMQFGDFLIPKDSSVCPITMALHNDPKYWKNPDKFDPLRFLPEESANRHPYCYIPFAAGPRNCIGVKYAMISLKVSIITVVRNFKIFTDLAESSLVLDLGATMKLETGYQVRMESRANLRTNCNLLLKEND